MTEQTQPTDAELLPLIEEHIGLKPRRDDMVIDPRTGRFHDVQRYRDFAADILAKWGTPAGVGEVADRADAVNLARNALGPYDCAITKKGVRVLAEAVLSMDAALTTSQPINSGSLPEMKEINDLQPTQAQAGAVPLTEEQMRTMRKKHPAEDTCGWSYELGIKDAEQHHGIKGGQHGTE